MPKFILFDIDGTLVSLDGAGSRSLNRAMEELLQVTDGFRDIDFAGKTDLQIIREGLGALGLADRDDLLHSLLDRYLVHLRAEVSTGRGHVKNGVRELLSALQNLENIYLGLLTGNAETGARLKLEPFGLNWYFPVGAFGSDSEDRNLLLPIAVQRLQEAGSASVNHEHCVVIGDTPKDVECAHVHGASSIAVATGTYPLKKLEKTDAELVIADLSDTEKIVDWIRHHPHRLGSIKSLI
jgi:phosphoglycolate phosphatase-like HAD superfamily hydrolase